MRTETKYGPTGRRRHQRADSVGILTDREAYALVRPDPGTFAGQAIDVVLAKHLTPPRH